jgi:hypothetical protein
MRAKFTVTWRLADQLELGPMKQGEELIALVELGDRIIMLSNHGFTSAESRWPRFDFYY